MIQANDAIDVGIVIEGQKFNWFRTSIVGWAFLIMGIEGYNMQALGYAAPSIIKAWHINKAYFGVVFSIGVIGYFLGATVLTNFADWLGRKTIIVCGALLFGSSTIASAYATSLTSLEVLRFIAGLGLGVSIPTIVALTVEFSPAKTRATTVGVMFVGYTAGAALGGFIAAKVMPVYGWQSAFYIGGFAALLVGFTLIFVLPESVIFLTVKQSQPGRVAAILRKLRPGMIFEPGARYVLNEERHPGLPVKYLFTDGRAITTFLFWTAYVASLIGHQFMTNWLPTVLNSSGESLSHAVMAAALFQAGGGLGGVLVCWLLDRRGTSAVAAAFALATILTVLMGSATSPYAVVIIIVFINGVAMIGGQIGLNALSGTMYPTYIRSTAVGWAFGVGRVGSIAGPLLGGVIISSDPPNSLLFSYAAIPLLTCTAALYLLGQEWVTRRVGQGVVAP